MIELDSEQVLHVRAFLSVTAEILVLFVGKFLNGRLAALREFNIPEPVTGGLLLAIAFGVVYLVSGIKVDFDLTARDILLVYFFTVIGINARVGDLLRGGKPLAALLAVTLAFMFAGNLVGVGAARLLGLDPSVGLLAASISMVGGHGTAIAWAPVIAETRGVANAMEIGVVCATMGLVLASVAGGPVARFLIQRDRIVASREQLFDVGVRLEAHHPQIDYFSFLRAILAIHVAVVIGILAHQGLENARHQVAAVSSMPGGGYRSHKPAAPPPAAGAWPCPHAGARAHRGGFARCVPGDVVDEHETLDLVSLAGPLAVLLGLQLVLAVLFAIYICFPAVGRGYDAAVVSSGFIGFALGATPTAMANMTAVTQRYGPSHVAFLIVPLVGAFFVDIANTLVIQLFLALL